MSRLKKLEELKGQYMRCLEHMENKPAFDPEAYPHEHECLTKLNSCSIEAIAIAQDVIQLGQVLNHEAYEGLIDMLDTVKKELDKAGHGAQPNLISAYLIAKDVVELSAEAF